MRRWWITRDYPAVVCAVFTGVTVLNSIMMIAGWDEPKTGTFAYLHLLSRLAIIAAVVGLFYLGDLWTWARASKRAERPELRHRMTRCLKLGFDAPFIRFVYAFTVVTAAWCLIAIALSFVTSLAGGSGLYLNLLLLAGMLAAWVTASELWQRRRQSAR